MSDVAPEAPAEPVAAVPVEAPVVEATPVVAAQPSSQVGVPAPVVVEREPVSLVDAAAAVVFLVQQHRTIGDADLGAAVSDLEDALALEASAADAV